MATSKSYFARQNYRFLSGDEALRAPLTPDSAFELDESDIYNNSVTTRSYSTEFLKSLPSSRLTKKSTATAAALTNSSVPGDRVVGTPSSLPVNIPDWSKILKDEYRRVVVGEIWTTTTTTTMTRRRGLFPRRSEGSAARVFGEDEDRIVLG
ncbi:hypothetical protein GH714_014368 [Hevea brasiliensis]|uniref:Uncharacterized protein n=1 Tax=Hevea brasiliensis TaxID=3981 RepID=A0A6A6LGN5_HEVBR|nr:hypothetical protein GH714_014368 [Hevea brasiliensis]